MWTLIEKCAHCGGLLETHHEIENSIKVEIEKVLEYSKPNSVLLEWIETSTRKIDAAIGSTSTGKVV